MSHKESQIEKRMADSGVRYTGGRRRVVSALARAEGPRSAAELHSELGTEIPLSSLYRSLAVLEETGVVEPHHGVKGITRYELAEWITGHHHHLVCVDCGAVEDIMVPKEVEVDLEDLIGKLGDLASFRVEGHSLEVIGTCSRCA